MKFNLLNAVSKKRRQTPFDIPEILERILAHVSQHNLRLSTSLVCKLWYAVSKPLIIHPASCKWNMQGDRVIWQKDLTKHLERAQSLSVVGLHSGWKTYIEKHRMHTRMWQFILEILEAQEQTNRIKLNTLVIHQMICWSTELRPTLKRLPMLTSLALIRSTLSPLPLTTILRLCPRLLHIKVFSDVRASLESDPIWKDSASETLLHHPLKSLTLQGMRIAKIDLATVLVCCPYLQLLHLVRLYNFTNDANNPSSTTADQSATLDDMKFFQRVAVLCPKITSLHVSHSTQRLAIDTAVALWTLFPLVTDWSLLDLDAPGLLTPSFLTRSINVLTWLEINTIPCVGPSALVLFHDFLCEASHLLHLKTGLALPLEPLDLEGNLTLKGYYRIKGDPELSSHDFSFQSPNYVRTKDRPRTIWACRNLRTLDVIFARQSGDTNSLDNSRLIFSYLSKVCPNLEDLTVNYRRVRFELQGGLCLLSRLHRLRRLVLMTDQRPEMQQRDLEWMSRQFSVAMQAKQLMLALMLVMGEPKDLDPLAPFTLPMDTIQGGRGRTADNKDLDYMIGGVDMRNLGRIRDITSLIDERTSKNWVCWPLIEEIQLLVDPYRGYYVGVNESISPLVKNLRPDIRFVHDIHTRS